MVATAATLEPVTAPNPAQPATEVMASPPGRRPNHFWTQSYRSTASPPRALSVPFELGRPFGAPDAPEFQRRVLLDCLNLLARTSGPVLEDFPDAPPGEAASGEQPDGWACPVNFAPPVSAMSDADVFHEALLQEVALLRPWYEQSRENRKGRTAFGISEKTPEEIVRFLADFAVAPEEIASPYDDTHVIVGFKRMADDLRYFYTEAAIARPDGRGTDLEIANWLCGYDARRFAGRGA